ncbi:hypothetical protein GCM10017783_05120 [Deinococcus piscis]|uniref:DUF559 domain-containing protein n=1 Tax=Deinococcus piscis TaxID=394230 RepID=A0ABQ3K1C4_9DEIO|nr:hypothetical protein GCM10017783_05120 [Deinococcus piscis]
MPLCGYILDFYAHVARLAIELDGPTHDTPEAQAYDAERTRVLEAAGLRVLRFQNREVMENFAGVCAVIDKRLTSATPPTPAGPPPLSWEERSE